MLISGVRSSRLKDRKKEEREILVKKAFLTDMMNENYLLCVLLEKESTSPILWEPYMLPSSCTVSQSYPSLSQKSQHCGDQNGCCIQNQQEEINTQGERLNKVVDGRVERPIDEATASMSTCHAAPLMEPYKNLIHTNLTTSDMEALEIVEDEDDLPVGLNVDSGSLACVACGSLGYPFMAVIQPTIKAAKMIFPITCAEPHEKADKSQYLIPSPCLQNDACNSTTEERCTKVAEQANLYSNCQLFPKSSVTSQHFRQHHMPLPMYNGSLFNYFSMDSLESKGETLDATDLQTTSNICVFENSANAFCSSGLRPCESVKENEGILRMKTSKMVENDFSSASWPFSDGDRESSLNDKVCVPEWDVSNVLLRPRVFCLQHAIEVEELLHDKGGGHIRVICHSDYLKFKAYAASIAEEMGTELHLKDFRLENASQEDLNLINISIDDEEHEEDGKDWTSKLGVNLRYSVKLRKYSGSTQEQLPSALRGMFSSSSTVSVVSSLKWLCRKSRTPAKPACVIAEKARVSATVDGGVQTLKVVYTDNTKTIQVYQSRKKKTGDLAFKAHNHQVKDLGGCKQNARVVGSEYMASDIENVENLFTVPISLIENHEISQNSVEKRNGSPSIDISTTGLSGFQLTAKSSTEYCDVNDHCFSRLNGLNNAKFVSVPVNYQYNQVYNNASTSNSSVPYNEEKNAGESCLDSNGEMATPELRSSEIKQLTGTVIETGSEPKFHDTVNLFSDHALLLIADEDERKQETQTAEEQNVQGSSRLLSVDSEMHSEPSITEELSSANCSVHCEGEQCGIISADDKMHKTESQAFTESILEGELGQIADNGILKHEASAPKPADYIFTEENVLQKSVDREVSKASSTGEDCAARDEGRAVTFNIKSYVRRKNKRKRDVEQGADQQMETEKTALEQKRLEIHNKVEAQQTSNGFARSPCEGLRPRKGKLQACATERNTPDRRISPSEREILRRGICNPVIGGRRKKAKAASDAFECDIEGCRMMFGTRVELRLHKRNRCTHDECRKRFSNHKYAMRHQRVHNDERPLKCSWKGCEMSFKWEWARTEHLRLHTGERPYKCMVVGCGLSFRFVSDFSRHRRKTGHFVSNSRNY